MGNELHTVPFQQPSGPFRFWRAGRPPSRPAEIGRGNSVSDSRRRVDKYCSRVDDELRASERRYPMVGVVVLALASALALGLVGSLLRLFLGI